MIQTVMAYMQRHNQVEEIVYRNICAEYGLEVPKSKREIPPKVWRMEELRFCETSRTRLINR